MKIVFFLYRVFARTDFMINILLTPTTTTHYMLHLELNAIAIEMYLSNSSFVRLTIIIFL